MKKYLISNFHILKMFELIDLIKSNKVMSLIEKKQKTQLIQNKIVECLTFIVIKHTKKYKNFNNYEDLIQEGTIALLKAVRHFDWTKYSNFFAYAEQWILQGLKRAASKYDLIYNPQKTKISYLEFNEKNDEIDEDLDLDKIIFKGEQILAIKKVLSNFPLRDREIINRIFGLEGHNPQSLREIGPVFNITYERTRQIKNNVIEKLKNNKKLNELFE